MKSSIIKEALKYFTSPVTEAFPATKPYFPKKYRGPPIYDQDKCMGCMACAHVCPADAITVTEKDGKRTLEVWYGKCTFCARCEEACPVDAIHLMEEYGIPSEDKFAFKSTVTHDMVKCKLCGKPFITVRHAEWIRKNLLEKIGDIVGPEEIDFFLTVCRECRHKIENIPEFRKLLIRVLIKGEKA